MEEDADNTELWLTWNDHSQILKNVLATLRYKELYADVTLVCGGKQYSVHRFILSTCSAYFEKLLETIPGLHPVVVLTNTYPKDLESLLDFMYLGQTEVSSQDLDRLLDVAYEFRIRGLISSKDDPGKKQKSYPPQEPRRPSTHLEEAPPNVEMDETSQDEATYNSQDDAQSQEGFYTQQYQTKEETSPKEHMSQDTYYQENQMMSPEDTYSQQTSYSQEDTMYSHQEVYSHQETYSNQEYKEEPCSQDDSRSQDPLTQEDIKPPSVIDQSQESLDPDVAVIATYTMPVSDPLMTEENREESLLRNGSKEVDVKDKSILTPEIKTEEPVAKPACVNDGLKEFENFIQKQMQASEGVAGPFESSQRPNIPKSSEKSITKKITKEPDPKVKKSKTKESKIDKMKVDALKQKEKEMKQRMENSKEKGGGGGKAGKPREETKTKIMMCPGCKKTFMNQSVLEEHMKSHEDLEIITCEQCPFKALNQQQMQKHAHTHLQKIEQKNRPFRCPYCIARFTDRPSFLRHQRTLHKDKKVLDTSMKSAKVVLEDCGRAVRSSQPDKDNDRS